jgi:hypothetical protein
MPRTAVAPTPALLDAATSSDTVVLATTTAAPMSVLLPATTNQIAMHPTRARQDAATNTDTVVLALTVSFGTVLNPKLTQVLTGRL